MEENNKMKYHSEEYIVAFIDVLGASAAMKDSPDEMLNKVHKVYESALEILNKLYPNEKSVGVRIFSDNIVVFCKYNKTVPVTSLASIVTLSAAIQMQFLNMDILVRGGISIGDFFNDDVMIWGNSLVNAYNIESHVSIYPRIVLDNNLIEKTKVMEYENQLKKEFITQDADGLFFVNYLTMIRAFEKRNLVDRNNACRMYLKDAMENIEKEKSKNDLKLLQKFNWHYRYLHNYMYDYEKQKFIFEDNEDNNKCEK